MKKGFTLIETLCVIVIISILIPGVYIVGRKITTTTNKYYNIEYRLYEVSQFFDFVYHDFNIYETTDYEIDGKNLYLTNGENFLLFYDDHTILNQKQYNIYLEKYQFIDDYLMITFKGDNYNYDLLIRGKFREIHSD